MSTFTEYNWSVIDTSAVCDVQNLSVAGALLLNGSLANVELPNQISFNAVNLIRSVSITSTNDLSAVSFTVSGFQNEAFVTETIVGPNNDTVFGTKYYDTIISVTTNAAVSQVRVGTGKAGYLPIIAIDTLSNNINYSCSVLLSSGAGITYSLLQTLDEVTSNWISFKEQSNKFFPLMGLTDETTSQIANTTAITNYILLNITDSVNPTTDSLKFIFLQQ